jgi:hypothetical protein
MPRTLAPDATIADVVADLVGPEGYVRKVLELMYRFKEAKPLVRIGISGKRPYPRYRIVSSSPDAPERVLGAFNDNGTAVPTSESNRESWSTGTMDMEGVKQLLGRVRDTKKGRA